jgi:sialate O-acetylesterase
VGLIDNAWGGSSCEAWVQRDVLAQHPDQYEPLLQRWADKEAQADVRAPYEAYEAALLQWQRDVIAAKQSGMPVPDQPPRPNSDMVTQHRPGNLFNGRVEPIMPYAIRGAIWYQGESNAGRAYQYRHLFPLMIQNWRDAWQQGPFSFYWVQLADFRPVKSEPAESDWAELREAQTMAQDCLPNTGEAVIIDIGEAADIHPRNKQEVGNRLARLALAQDYGIQVASRSPRYESLQVEEGKAVLSFKETGGGLRTVDHGEVLGFAIAGADQQWHPAQAKLRDGKTIEVWSEAVTEPVAVRYAWADNPVCNVYTTDGLPLTPFRTDDWPGITANSR